jgi:hypothetical protein
MGFGLPGCHPYLVKGRAVAPKDRSGASFGTYRVTGRRLYGSEGKHYTAISARQVGAADVTADTTTLTDSFAMALESGESKIRTINVQCYSGLSIYMTATVPDLTVEIRHGTVGSFIDLESTPFDLAPYDGNVEVFQIRITAPATTTEYLREVQIYVGPPVTSFYLTNDAGDQLTNDTGGALTS